MRQWYCYHHYCDGEANRALDRGVGCDSDVPTLVWKILLEAELRSAIDAKILAALEGIRRGLPRLEAGQGWQSEQTLHARGEFLDLAACVGNAARSVLRFLRIGYEAVEITGCWATVLARGAARKAHSHPNNFLSGVYYVRTRPGSDAINFYDPRTQAGVIRPPVVDAQEPQDNAGCIADARGQIEELPACVQRLFRLPALAGLQPGQAAPYSFKRRQDLCVDCAAQLRLEQDLPHQRGEHRNHIRRLDPALGLLHHRSNDGSSTVAAWPEAMTTGWCCCRSSLRSLLPTSPWIGFPAHSPPSPSWPQVRMFFSGPRPSEGAHLKPRMPAVRSAPKTPSSCSIEICVRGLSLCTKITGPLDLPSTSKAPETTVMS